MSGPRASTTYKKKDGTLAFNKTKLLVTWTPVAPSGSPAQVTILISDITNLQQTPASNPKVALKIIVQHGDSPEPENHVFNFISTTAARSEQETMTDALRTAISASKAGTVLSGAALPKSDGGGHSGAITFATSVNSSAKAAEDWYDDQKLRSDVKLQQSLLSSNATLRQIFETALREKPEGISNSQFGSQFWGARLHLLRAHAIDKNQSQGMYNVLSEVKPKIVDGATKLNLSKEQIQLIFKQHPLVKHVYNETVPRLSEMEFWARFFVSRLFKKLKGERIIDSDSTDAILDKYLSIEEDPFKHNESLESHIPHFIDLEGNEQNHSQRRGNQPDFTMRPNAVDKVPILRVLNAMSEKMMAGVAPADGDPHAPIGMDEETFNELRLRDLQAEEGDDHVVLNITDHGSLFGGSSGDQQISKTAIEYAKYDPAIVLVNIVNDLDPSRHDPRHQSSDSLDLTSAIGLRSKDAESSSDSDSELLQAKNSKKPNKPLRPGSRASLARATTQVTSLLAQSRAHMTGESQSGPKLAPHILTSLTLTHNTTTEFLHYFWSLFLHSSTATTSAAADKDLPSLLATLSNSLTRINAVADTAEAERQAHITELKRKAAEYTARTGRKRRVDERKVTMGGRKEVEQLMAPTVAAIGVAKEAFERTLREQMEALKVTAG